MKKLIARIRSREKETDLSGSKKKANPKTKEASSISNQSADSNEPRDLFWDGYSDIGYC